MNKEDYVSLEVAKLLKEKGFNDVCDRCYYIEDEEIAPLFYGTYQNEGELYVPGHLAAPTLYEASKWLRENHNIHIDVKCTAYCKPLNRCDYICEIFALSSHQFIDTEIYHKYEEALNAGILEALKMI